MRRTDFEEGLRALEAEAAEAGLPADADARLRARLGRDPRRSHRPALVVALVAAALAVVASASLRTRPSLGGFVATERSTDFVARVAPGGGVAVERGTAVLRDERAGALVRVEAGAVVGRAVSGATVLAGKVRFEVDHRAGGASPYAVQVSAGVIEVLGTCFTVTQEAAGGEVWLEQGTVRFTAPDGRAVTLAPGERLRWPLPPVSPPAVPPESSALRPAPPVAPPRPAPAPPAARPASPPAPASVDAVLEEVAALRTRGRFEEAAHVLERALAGPLPEAAAERLEFELGSILSHHLHDGPRACAHWRRTLAAHPAGRYASEIATELAELRCPPP